MVRMFGSNATLRIYCQMAIPMNIHQTVPLLRKPILWMFGSTLVHHTRVSWQSAHTSTIQPTYTLKVLTNIVVGSTQAWLRVWLFLDMPHTSKSCHKVSRWIIKVVRWVSHWATRLRQLMLLSRWVLKSFGCGSLQWIPVPTFGSQWKALSK